jgi:glycosyltransferase involved in cell wall biosynthesis
MKIMAVVDRAWKGVHPSGGAETMIHDLMRYLAKVGWEASAIVMAGAPSVHEVDGVLVRTNQDKRVIHSLASEADVLLTHLGATPRARAMGELYGKPVAQLIHNTNQYSVGFLGDGCDFAIYNSEWVSEYHAEKASMPIVNSYQENGHSIIRKRRCSSWPSVVVRPPAEEPIRLGGNPYGAITLVNLVPNKGPHILYGLAERNPALSFIGVIGGYERDKQVIREDLPNVLVHQHTKNIDDYLSQTAIALVASKYESYGRVAVEAMARGIPVLATATPGLEECIGSAGHLVEDRENLDSWQVGIEEYLMHYEHWSSEVSARYASLQAQTIEDLKILDYSLKELVRKWQG